MSKVYIRLLAVAAFVIAVTGATFSIAGLAKLFAGAATAVAFMAGALEFAKLVVTGFLYRYWGHIHRPMRIYLTCAVVTLVAITSVGIFGFLSHAYQVSSMDFKTKELQIKALQAEGAGIDKQMTEIRRFINEIPRNRITKKFEFQRRYEPELQKLQRRTTEIFTEVEKEKISMLKTHAEIGPIVYLAQAIGAEVDTVVKWLIFIFVLVFDPLAVSLVFCLNIAIRLREKYRGNEVRISAHSMTTPVDHRLHRARFNKGKKAA